MAKGSSQATGAATSAQNLSNQLQGNATSLYGALEPTLQQEAVNPQGYGPTTKAGIVTANEQGAGGSEAAAVGQGGLKAARTRNAGGADAAIQSSARNASQQLGKENLTTQLGDANLKQKQQQEGISGLGNLYGTDIGSSISALGQVAPNVNANTNAANQQWDWARYILDPAMQAGGTPAAGAGF